MYYYVLADRKYFAIARFGHEKNLQLNTLLISSFFRYNIISLNEQIFLVPIDLHVNRTR